MQLPKSQTSAPELDKSLDQPKGGRTSNQLLAALSIALAKGDAKAASELVAEAGAAPTSDPALRPALLKCKSLISRSEWLEAALQAMRHDFEDDHFASAIGHFREALGLSRQLPLLKARVDEQAHKYAEELLPHNWRVAQTLMQEAAQVDPPLKPSADFEKQVKQACEDELVTLAIFKADRLEQEGKAGEARQWLNQFLATHPKEVRISERIHLLDHPEPASAAETATKLAPQPGVLSPQPPDSELDTVGTLNGPPGAPAAKPWRTRIIISNAALDVVKNWCAVGGAVAMLGLAGFLIWRHVVVPPRPARVATPPVVMPAAAPKTNATSAVATKPAVFEDVPVLPSDRDQVLAAIRSYADAGGNAGARRQINAELLDEVAVSGDTATVRYRAKSKNGNDSITFSLLRQAGNWKVLSTH